MLIVIDSSEDIFESPATQGAKALVNPVNCGGVYGKGLALEFKKRYPNAVRWHQKMCHSGVVAPGSVWGDFEDSSGDGIMILHAATKDDWRYPSQLGWVKSCLDRIARFCETFNIDVVAIPALGCGLGGLDFADVRTAAETIFSNTSVVGLLYEPREG